MIEHYQVTIQNETIILIFKDNSLIGYQIDDHKPNLLRMKTLLKGEQDDTQENRPS